MSYQEERLQEIADAIREVKGTTEKIPATNFASEIVGLSVVKPSGIITITENGSYNVADKEWAEVNVASGGATPFADATPEEIQQVANEISAKGMTSAEVKSKYGWKIGDTKDITLTTGEVIQIRIIGFNHDNLTGGGIAGITLDMATCLNSYYPMDSDRTNAGGWEVTDMRNTTLPTIKTTLPQEWQNIIKKVDKKSANGGSTNFSAVVTTSDDLFLLSEIEVFGKFIQAQNSTDEGFVYEYYSINNTQDSRKKPIGSYNQWWLRSSNIDSTTSFLIVDYNGGEGSSTATSTDKISFAFCIGSAKDIPIAGLPIEATTDQEMTNALTQDNLGKVYKFTGTSDTYETDAIYIVSEV